MSQICGSFRVGLVGLVALLLGAGGDAVVQAQDGPVEPCSSGTIAFVGVAGEEEDAAEQVYLVDAQWEHLRLLNDLEVWRSSEPHWSPDGTRLAYVADLNGEPRAVVVEVAGGSYRELELTIGQWSDFDPLWLDDTHIGYEAWDEQDRQNRNFYVIDLETLESQLLFVTHDFHYGMTLSPDGETLLYAAFAANAADLYLMNFQGKILRQLNDDAALDTAPAWSPDGTQIAYVTDGMEGGNIAVMDADGRHARRITDNPTWEWTPAWSPDGACLAIVTTLDDESGVIAIMDLEGTMLRTVAPTPSSWGPAWHAVNLAEAEAAP